MRSTYPPPRAGTSAGAAQPTLQLSVYTLWRALRQESWAFLVLLVYVAWEYWRPQSIWLSMDVIPWGTATILAAVTAFFLGGERGRRFHPMDGFFILFSGWVFLTIPFAFDVEESLGEWAMMATWVVMYFLVSHLVVTPRRMVLFWAALMVVFLKMSQHGARTWVGRGFSFADWGVSGSPVWFQNSGEFAMGMVIFTAMSWCVLVAIRPYVSSRFFWIGVALLPTTALMSVLASSSRGGQLAALVVLVVLAYGSRFWLRGMVIGAMVLAIGWQVLPPEQKERFAVMGSAEDSTGQFRLISWRHAVETVREYPVFGVGYESWIPYYASTGVSRVQEIHNTFLEVPAELGIPGALLFLALLVGSFVTNRRTRRRMRGLGPWGDIMYGMAKGLDVAMLGLLVASFFMSVLFYPVYWMAFALSVALSESSKRVALGAPRTVRVPRGMRGRPPLPAFAGTRQLPAPRPT